MTTPLQRFFVAIVMLGLLPTACVAAVPFAPYGTANGDAQLTSTDQLFGPYSLPTPMPTDNGTVSQYYVCTTGGIFFKTFSYAGLVYSYKNYSNTYGPMIGAATAHMHNAANGYYHRTISGPGAALDALWSDVLPGGIPIVPTDGLVFTVDNSYLYPSTTSLVQAQTIVLWNSTSSLMLFRIKSVTYTSTAVVAYGGYLGPSTKYLIPGVATTWASSSNTGVNGLYTVLMNQAPQAPQPSKTAAPSRTATGPTPSISHSQSLSPTASISVSLTKLTPSLSLSPTSLSKSFSKTLL
ncbi:membrane-associated protein, putative, partial [Bodo saltans]